MRAQRPVSDAHMAEAVRRGVITAEQMEALLALARSEATPGEARLPDLRWTAVVSALAATVAVLAPGFAMLLDIGADDLTVAGASAAALVVCAIAGRVVRVRGWGRAPAAVLTAGVAPYAGGVALGLVRLGLERVGVPTTLGFGYGAQQPQPFLQFYRGVAIQILVATLVATLAGAAIWRARRVGPTLAVSGFFLPFVVMAAGRVVWPLASMTPFRLAVVATSVLSLAIAAGRSVRGRGEGVDGTSWWELGAFAAAAVSITAGFSDGLGGVALWTPAALLVGALGLWSRRWTYQLAGTLGLLWFLGLGLWREPMAVRAAALVGVCALVATATQWQRRRESRRVVEREVLAYWE